MKIDIGEDGKKRLACTKENPQIQKYAMINKELHIVYHPDAKLLNEKDKHYYCPNCKRSWWD